jgi:hypothetical protein
MGGMRPSMRVPPDTTGETGIAFLHRKQENTLMASFLFVPMGDTARSWNVSSPGRSSDAILAAARKFVKEYRSRYSVPESDATLMFEAGRAFQRYAEVNGSVEKSLDVNLLSRMGTLSFDPA